MPAMSMRRLFRFRWSATRTECRSCGFEAIGGAAVRCLHFSCRLSRRVGGRSTLFIPGGLMFIFFCRRGLAGGGGDACWGVRLFFSSMGAVGLVLGGHHPCGGGGSGRWWRLSATSPMGLSTAGTRCTGAVARGVRLCTTASRSLPRLVTALPSDVPWTSRLVRRCSLPSSVSLRRNAWTSCFARCGTTLTGKEREYWWWAEKARRKRAFELWPASWESTSRFASSAISRGSNSDRIFWPATCSYSTPLLRRLALLSHRP